MTEPPRQSGWSLSLTVVAAAVVVTLVIAAGLWLQMAAGRDPALGSAPASVAQEPGGGPKRVVKTTVVRRIVPGVDAAAAGSARPSSATAASAPAASATPASEPAPAPVQTATS